MTEQDLQDILTKINSATGEDRIRLKQLYFPILYGSCKPIKQVEKPND